MTMESIGELIRLRLKEDGHSVSWFARKLSCTRATVSYTHLTLPTNSLV